MTSRRLPSVLVLAAVIIAACAATAAATAARVVTAKLGSEVRVSGRTGSLPGKSVRAVGVVVLRGRWGTGPWLVLKTTRTDRTGSYRFAVSATRRGVLTLRVSPPDRHEQRYVVRVV